MADLKCGDMIAIDGMVYVIGVILCQECWDGDGWDVEFLDNTAKYRHWKQWIDGGRVIRR